MIISIGDTMEKEAARLIRDNRNLISSRNFDEFYRKLEVYDDGSEETASLVTTTTEMFFAAGIDPTPFFKEHIPTAYAYNLTLPNSTIVIHKPVEIICEDAFTDIENCEIVKLPVTLKTIDNYAFAYDRALKEMHYPGTYDEWKKIGKGFSWARGTNFILFCSDWAVEINSGLEKVL